MVQAYILIQTEVGKASTVADTISKLPGVIQAEDVTGPYDVIVRAQADTVDDLGRLVSLQTKLLWQACQRVRPGGAVMYSTCSIEPEENGQVVRAVLQGMSELALEAEEGAVPGRPADGGYWARLRKRVG